MKSLLIFLFSATVFAQIPNTDTLYLLSGKSYPCLITNINETKAEFIYSDNINESIILRAVQRISLEEHGTVYLSINGFTTDLEKLETFVNMRFQKIQDKKLAKEEEERLSSPNKVRNQNILDMKESKINRWSFGVLYIPYYSGKIYTIINTVYPPYRAEPYALSDNEINMEAQLSFGVTEKLRLTFDVSYTSKNYERRNESHSRSTNSRYDNGNFTKEDLTQIDFNIGIKYYFISVTSEKVSIYALAGFGKKFASAEQENKILFQDPPTPILFEDNLEEFVEDSNSPFHYNIGFGAEYFFNESLAITSNIRFIYSKIKAKYDSRSISEFETFTNTIDYKTSDFITRVGLGLNFYF